MPTSPPKPNTLALSWFYGEHQKGTLILQPKYQRNPIWSRGQQCFLIDSLISGCPIPQVYINIRSQGEGKAKMTYYEVVDGQQRLRTIIEFISEEWALIPINEHAYPISDVYKGQFGKKYPELPKKLQDAIWDYPLAVQEIRGWDDQEIRAMFRRLNYVNERLNKQELRHSQYFGEFNQAAEQLSTESFWDEIHLFSRRDSQRMKDVEFVSELFVIVIDGIQDQQKTLDRFYAEYDVSFPRKAKYISKFRQVLESLRSIANLIRTTRFGKRADFYALFAAALQLNQTVTTPVDLTGAELELRNLSKELESPADELKGLAQQYYTTVIEGPNKLAKRRLRTEILHDLLGF